MKKELFYFKNRSIALLCIAGLLILFNRCTYFQSDQRSREPIGQSPAVHLPPAYLEAVRDAANPEPGEVYGHLIPVAASNPKLVRKTFDGEECPDLVPYPWTQLGYTYDWGNPETEVGLSEFVIKTNSKVKVNRIESTLKYCNRQ